MSMSRHPSTIDLLLGCFRLRVWGLGLAYWMEGEEKEEEEEEEEKYETGKKQKK